ncbi:MAG: thioredoxin TrxC [Acidobacteriota bacterium]
MSGETRLIQCPSCGAKNRVADAGQGKRPVCGRCKTPLQQDHPITVTDENFSEIVERSQIPVLLDVWAPWCMPCRIIAPVIEELAAELAGRLRVAKLNSDENPQTASRFNVRGIPTLLLFKDGREMTRLAGAYPKADILRAVAPFI